MKKNNYEDFFRSVFINPKRKGNFIEGQCPLCNGNIWGHITTSSFNCRRTSCKLSSGDKGRRGTAKDLIEILGLNDSSILNETQDNSPDNNPNSSIDNTHNISNLNNSYPLQKLHKTVEHHKLLTEYLDTCKHALLHASESFPLLYKKLLLEMGFSHKHIATFGYTSFLPFLEPKEFPSLVIPYYDESMNIRQLKFIRYFNRLKRKQSKEINKPKSIYLLNQEIYLDNRNFVYNSWNVKNDDKPIIVVEGELKAELLTQWGYCAIALGGTDAPEEYKSLIAERNVTIMLDSDAPGRDSVSKIIKASRDAESIRTIDLFPESVSKKDPNDIIEFSKLYQEAAPEKFAEIYKTKAILHKEDKINTEGKIYTLEEVINTEHEHQSWILKGIIPNEGVSLVFAPPRMGKTFWLIDVCRAVAEGGTPMNSKEHTIEKKGRVLYISLEDTIQSFKERAIHLGLDISNIGKNFHVAVNWRPFQNDSGINDIQRWVNEYPDARLVVIDTYVTVKSRQKDNSRASGYEFGTEELTKLRKICRSYSIGIILVWHTTKATMNLELENVNKDNFMQYAMDSTSLTASTDSAIMLFRQSKRNNEGKLFAKPKTGKVVELNMHYDEEKCKWEVIPDKFDLSLVENNETVRILETIYIHEECSLREIIASTRLKTKTVIECLDELKHKSIVQKRLNGNYIIAHKYIKDEIQKRLQPNYDVNPDSNIDYNQDINSNSDIINPYDPF